MKFSPMTAKWLIRLLKYILWLSNSIFILFMGLWLESYFYEYKFEHVWNTTSNFKRIVLYSTGGTYNFYYEIFPQGKYLPPQYLKTSLSRSFAVREFSYFLHPADFVSPYTLGIHSRRTIVLPEGIEDYQFYMPIPLVSVVFAIPFFIYMYAKVKKIKLITPLANAEGPYFDEPD